MEVAFTSKRRRDDLQASAVSFPNGSEQYVCLTYNNSTLTGNLYTNGVLVATQTYPNTTYCSWQHWRRGRHDRKYVGKRRVW